MSKFLALMCLVFVAVGLFMPHPDRNSLFTSAVILGVGAIIVERMA